MGYKKQRKKHLKKVSIDTIFDRNMTQRPSHKEISGKINKAIKCIQDGLIRIINREAIISEALELGYLFEDEFSEILIELLENTKPEDYIGTRPPQKSYDSEITGLDLFAFVVESKILEELIYYKFSVRNDICYVVSLHKNRERS